jgi:hypothetical protein
MKRRKRELQAVAREHGRTVRETKRGHYALEKPGVSTVFTAGSPSDWRGDRNLVTQLRRYDATTEEQGNTASTPLASSPGETSNIRALSRAANPPRQSPGHWVPAPSGVNLQPAPTPTPHRAKRTPNRDGPMLNGVIRRLMRLMGITDDHLKIYGRCTDSHGSYQGLAHDWITFVVNCSDVEGMRCAHITVDVDYELMPDGTLNFICMGFEDDPIIVNGRSAKVIRALFCRMSHLGSFTWNKGVETKLKNTIIPYLPADPYVLVIVNEDMLGLRVFEHEAEVTKYWKEINAKVKRELSTLRLFGRYTGLRGDALLLKAHSLLD